MKPFLRELAEEIKNAGLDPESLTFVFPNRRAIVYFRKHFASVIDKPVFSPSMMTIEDFIAGYSTYSVPDRLTLVQELHKVYSSIIGKDEGFDRFYFWGDMLLRDFDEIDKHLIDARLLFSDLSKLKELDTLFDYMSAEQLKLLQSFWDNVNKGESAYREKFLSVWSHLHDVYTRFRETLDQQGLAHEGMLQRAVAEAKEEITLARDGKVIFVGFNALTGVEKAIITHLVDKGLAEIRWDIDAYYVNDYNQEAGTFMRQYQEDASLAETFPADIPANFNSSKSVSVFASPSATGQAKLMAQILAGELANGADPEDTLVILPDEKLLIPVLHGVAAGVERFNVTMGFPLAATPGFTLVELLVELQAGGRGRAFSHRHVIALLNHPYLVAADPKGAQEKSKLIKRENRVYLSETWLSTENPIFSQVFRSGQKEHIVQYLRDIVTAIAALEDLSVFDREYLFHFIRLLNRLEPVMTTVNQGSEVSDALKLDFFLRLFRQLVRAERIPFSGEPLHGLQIMGVLETRTLDFKNVYMLSLNEGLFPAAQARGSYLPHNVRRAYGLPTVEHHDAIYGYLFYRVLQRAEKVFLFYNSETDVLGLGEMSRYLRQLIYESNLPLKQATLHTPPKPNAIDPIIIKKDAAYYRGLDKFCEGPGQVYEMTPSALNDYITCSLKFYFRYIARIMEPFEVEEELDARMLGLLLHETMEQLYTRIIAKKGSNLIEAKDLEDYAKEVDGIINDVFITTYKLDGDKPVEYEGQRLIVKEILKRFVGQIMKMDQAYAPFNIEGLEIKDLSFSIQLPSGGQRVVLGGRVDRADRKRSRSGAEVLRVIDYKAGKDKTDLGEIEDLFSRTANRNKAALQVLFYALLFRRHYKDPDLRLVPGLINRVNLFDEDFQFGLKMGKKSVDDVDTLLPEFEERLTGTLEEMFDQAVPVEKTSEVDACKICPYRGICYR